jgi:tRNA pseudouridine32 synthase/23S rRNA pseudouridine746 synthase
VVIDKPSGLLSVPGIGPEKQDCAVSRVRAMFPHAAGPMMVHRLDMATSGLIVMARGLTAQQRLNAAFSERQVHKRYLAVVHGDCQGVAQAWQTIDLPILVDWPRRPLRKIDLEHGKPSTTRWRCIAFDAATNSSRLELEPLTGRSHQLRVHLQSLIDGVRGQIVHYTCVESRQPPCIAVRTARAKGLPERTVILRHALRNALLPMVTLLGLNLPFLFSGAVLIEYVFAWPGMGRVIVTAIQTQDVPLIMGCFFVFTLLVVAGGILADLLYSVVDPRIRFGE